MEGVSSGRTPSERARAKWQQHIEAWLASGLRQVDYCRQHGIEPNYLRVWRRKLAFLGAVPPAKRRSPRSSAPPPSMIPIIVKPDLPASAAMRSPSLSAECTVSARLPNGIALSFDLKSREVLSGKIATVEV